MGSKTSSCCWSLQVLRTQELLATRVRMARALGERMVGLLGRSCLEEGEGLILAPCRSIHTYFMRFAIDAVFVDRAWDVVALSKALPPWRFSAWNYKTVAVVELPVGAIDRARLVLGDRLGLQPCTCRKET